MSAKEYKKNVGIFLCSFFIYDMFYAKPSALTARSTERE